MAAGTLSPVFKQYFPDANGRPLAGARIYSFASGTSTPIPIFADALLTTPLENPAIADGSGRLTFWLSPTSYKFAVHDANDVLQYAVDNVGAVPPNEIDLDVQGIAGESLGDRAVAYLAGGAGGTTPGQWYLTDADSVDTSTGVNIIGIVPQAIGSGSSGAIRLQGRVDGFSGLTPGASYFISAVPGEITAVAPANARFIGIADSTTSLVLTVSGVAQAQPPDPNFNTVTISNTGASALQVAGGIVVDGPISSTNTAHALGALRVTGVGGAAAGKIGLSGNQLSFFGGSSGHAFFNSGGGLQTSVDAAGNWTITDALTVTGVTTLNSAENVFGAFRVTGIGAAAAGKIGLNGNQLSFLGGSSGHAFLTSAGGPTTTVDAAGNWSMFGHITLQGCLLQGTGAVSGSAGSTLTLPSLANGVGGGRGQAIVIGRNSSGNGSPGILQLQGRSGGFSQVWVDSSALLRIQTGISVPSEGSGDTVGTVVGTQVSTRATKRILEEVVTPEAHEAALTLVCQTPLYRFVYKNGAYNNEEFLGIVTDDSPVFGMDGGRSFNPVSAFGYTVASVKALKAENDALRQSVDELRASISALAQRLDGCEHARG